MESNPVYTSFLNNPSWISLSCSDQSKRMSDSGDGDTDSHHDEPVETTPLLPTHHCQRYSTFTTLQKRLIILAAALASAFSPLSANIYYPALNSIAKDLKVSTSQINLTITTYMVRSPQFLLQIYLDSFGIQKIDMPGHRTDIYRIPCRPRRSSPGVHLLLCDLHCRKYRPRPAALVPGPLDSPSDPELRE